MRSRSSHLFAPTSPFNANQPTPKPNASKEWQVYLKDVRDWNAISFGAFTVDPYLIRGCLSEDEQRRFFIMRRAAA